MDGRYATGFLDMDFGGFGNMKTPTVSSVSRSQGKAGDVLLYPTDRKSRHSRCLRNGNAKHVHKAQKLLDRKRTLDIVS
jgi:hypothetical protein